MACVFVVVGCSSGVTAVEEPTNTQLTIGEENPSNSESSDDAAVDQTSTPTSDGLALNEDVTEEVFSSVDADEASPDAAVENVAESSCAEVPIFESPLEPVCSGTFAAAPELFASTAGWHIFENTDNGWTEIDFGATCCREPETSLDLLLERNRVPLADITSICVQSRTCEDTVIACQTGGQTQTGQVINVSQSANLRIGPATNYPVQGEFERNTEFVYFPNATTFAEGRTCLLTVADRDQGEERDICAWLAADLAGDENGNVLGPAPARLEGLRLTDPGDPDVIHTLALNAFDTAVGAPGYLGNENWRFAVRSPAGQFGWLGRPEQLIVRAEVDGYTGEWLPSGTIVYEPSPSTGAWDVVFAVSNADAQNWIGGDIAYYSIEQLDTSGEDPTVRLLFWSVDPLTFEEVDAAMAECTYNADGELDCDLEAAS